jgi:hypothetical protein
MLVSINNINSNQLTVNKPPHYDKVNTFGEEVVPPSLDQLVASFQPMEDHTHMTQ